jgi:hypothetical protein
MSFSLLNVRSQITSVTNKVKKNAYVSHSVV